MRRKTKRHAYKPEFTADHWWLSLQSFLQPGGIFSVRKYRACVPRFATSKQHFHHLHALITSDVENIQWTDVLVEATSPKNTKVVLCLVPVVRKAEAASLVQQIDNLQINHLMICSVNVTANSLKMLSALCGSIEIFHPLLCLTKPQLHSGQVPMRLAREEEYVLYTGRCVNDEDALKFPSISASDPMVRVLGFKTGSIVTFVRDSIDGPTQEFRHVTP